MSNKRINDLLCLMAQLDNSIIQEIMAINRGDGHSPKVIGQTLKYWIDDRITFMEREKNSND